MKVVLPAFAQRGGFIPDASAVSAVCDLEGGRCTTIAMVGRPEQPAAEQPESCPTEGKSLLGRPRVVQNMPGKEAALQKGHSLCL